MLAGKLQEGQAACQSVIDAHPGVPSEPKARLLMGYILIKARAPKTEAIAHRLIAAARRVNAGPVGMSEPRHTGCLVQSPIITVTYIS